MEGQRQRVEDIVCPHPLGTSVPYRRGLNAHISNLAPASDSARLASLQRREEPRAEKSEAMIRHLDFGLFMKSGRGLGLVMPRCQGECICHLQQFPPGGGQ